jgi:mannose-6-phosphate isomerase
MIQIVKKPWGQEEIWAKTSRYVGKILTINPGHRLSLQYHEEKEETIYVLEGVLKVWDSEDDNSYRMYSSGSVVHIVPNQVHRFGAAPGEYQVRLMEVSTPELEDVVRIKDDYSR